jgi:hypothetical protein
MTTSPPNPRTACAISTATGSAAEHEQTAWNGLHAGRLAAAPDAVELAQARHGGTNGSEPVATTTLSAV